MSPEDRKSFEEKVRALEGRAFATSQKIGDQIRALLTVEQLEKEKILLANRPKFLPPLPRPMRGGSEAEYRPGADSWRPGQGNPDENKEKPNRRPFPKADVEM
jgi:hypothetical protein